MQVRPGQAPIVIPKDGQNNGSGTQTDKWTTNKDGSLYIEDKSTKPKQKVNWDGDVVPDGPWLDRELFKVGDVSVTN